MLGLAANDRGKAGTGGGLIVDDGLDLKLLIAEAGRRGGRMGLVVSTLKKLELRLFEEGEGGNCERVFMVLSDRDGRGFRFALGVSGGILAGSDWTGLTFSSGSNSGTS